MLFRSVGIGRDPRTYSAICRQIPARAEVAAFPFEYDARPQHPGVIAAPCQGGTNYLVATRTPSRRRCPLLSRRNRPLLTHPRRQPARGVAINPAVRLTPLVRPRPKRRIPALRLRTRRSRAPLRRPRSRIALRLIHLRDALINLRPLPLTSNGVAVIRQHHRLLTQARPTSRIDPRHLLAGLRHALVEPPGRIARRSCGTSPRTTRRRRRSDLGCGLLSRRLVPVMGLAVLVDPLIGLPQSQRRKPQHRQPQDDASEPHDDPPRSGQNTATQGAACRGTMRRSERRLRGRGKRRNVRGTPTPGLPRSRDSRFPNAGVLPHNRPRPPRRRTP
jgi:hypothetical protein